MTPFVLGRIGEVTAGSSIPANLALAENNCRVAAEVAVGHRRRQAPVRPNGSSSSGPGFGGLAAVKGLRDAPVDVTLVDANNFHTFQPLLYQVATAGLDVDDVAYPVRGIFRRQRNVTVRMARVTGIDLDGRLVQVDRATPLPYDYLVIAAGAVSADYGVPGRRRARLRR